MHSDVDLMFLFSGVICRADERFLHALLNALWDLGLTIGHHVREVAECDVLESDISEFMLALTDPAARNLSHVVPATVPSGLPVDER